MKKNVSLALDSWWYLDELAVRIYYILTHSIHCVLEHEKMRWPKVTKFLASD